ncbi:MAG: NADH-quinone oxidoreductase subunit M [Candidatus Methanomethylicota archaeon]|uniref:NADH dehydrogenase n=1 Tax=Thermoproteota archaeon TaxID=2056631 RepID=A0A523BDI7_9CREN|nr:MAG: NADH dehydrogenase [Candidatus Verstraetearchaeota archaeon]TDA39011.1 MAG: NADH-quinone oxidoreductase subunit M [Candidatus Verstraetearchaeota archaeon]
MGDHMMYIPYALLQIVILPLIFSPIIALIGMKIGKRVGWITCSVLTYTTFLLIITGYNIWNSSSPIIEEYSWSIFLFNLKFGFLADGLSLPVALIMNIICNALVVYSIEYLDHRIHVIYKKSSNSLNAYYYSLFMFFATGLMGISFATNLIEVYVFLDILLIPLYFIMDSFGYIDRHKIAMMCFIWGFVAGVIFLGGSIIAYSQIGSFEISELSALIGKPLAIIASLFMLLGMLIKLAVFGFHVWLPWVHAEHPTCIAGILAAIVGIENYLIARIFIQHLFEIFELFSLPLMIWALITMIYGAMLTIAQDDVKRLYACSTIGQTAYSLLGLASCTTFGAIGGVFYFLSHSLGKAILFSVAGIIVYQTGIRNMQEMGGLAKKMPITASLCILGSMILSAIPPLSGFFAEWIMFVGIFGRGSFNMINMLIAIIGLFATFLTLIYTFWPAIRMFFGPLPSSLNNTKEAPLIMLLPLIILALISFIIGIYPEFITRFLTSSLTLGK